MTNESEALKVIRDAIFQSELEWDQEEPSAIRIRDCLRLARSVAESSRKIRLV